MLVQIDSLLKTICCCLVAKSCPTLVTTWTVAHQAPLSMGFSKHEYWSGLPFKISQPQRLSPLLMWKACLLRRHMCLCAKHWNPLLAAAPLQTDRFRDLELDSHAISLFTPGLRNDRF